MRAAEPGPGPGASNRPRNPSRLPRAVGALPEGRPGRKRLLAAGLVLAVAGLGATPYRGERFELTLPEDWQIRPRFGDLDGMGFVRTLPGRLGGGMVRVDVRAVSVDSGFGPAAPGGGEPRSRNVGSKPVVFRVEPAGDGRVRERARFRRGDWDVEIRISYPQRDRRSFEPDLARLLKSFRPSAGGAGATAESDHGSEGPAIPDRLTGTWEGQGGARLVLAPDGRFRLAGRSGQASFADGVLALRIAGEEARRLRVRMEGPDRMRLEGSGIVARYRRVENPWAGRWRGSGIELVLRKDGSFQVADRTGTWRRQERQLTLVPDRGTPIRYRMKMMGEELVLSGADLDQPLRLRRAGP